MSEEPTGTSGRLGGRLLGAVVILGLAWIAVGTEWSLVFEKEAVLRGVVVEDVERVEDETCRATLDLATLPARPTRVTRGGDEVALEGSRGSITYPRGPGPLSLRLTYVGVLRKPSHADITLHQDGCRLQATGFESMPFLPF